MLMAERLHVVWFKRDLRVRDHQALHAACSSSRNVLPLFIIQPSVISGDDFDARHWEFQRQCLLELREKLAQLGAPLVVRQGEAVEVLHDIHRSVGIAALYSHEETGNLATYAIDQAVARWAHEHAIRWHEFPQNGVIRRLRTRTGWAARWEKRMAQPLIPEPTVTLLPHGLDAGNIPAATELSLPQLSSGPFQAGGESEAWSTLESFLQHRGGNYSRALSSPVTAWEGCSRLSTHLAWGTISMRSVVQHARNRLLQLRELRALGRLDNFRLSALSSFISRLHWRCHFMQKLEDFPEMELRNLWSAADGLRPNDPDCPKLTAWREGRTGYPFLDACLRAVRATGWMNFRMRAMMMSFAAYDLWLHWREPGLHLARCFTDYEPGIHWPQVQMQSGTTGINTLRIYDPVKQGLDHDPQGEFTRRWVPELQHVPLPYVHRPWLMSPLLQAECGVVIGRDYPSPIVDHTLAIRTAKELLYNLRKKDSARREADAIQQKHGSRKSGLPPTTAKRRRSTASDAAQPLLF